jgi:transposase
MAVMARSKRGSELPVEEKARVVLAVLGGELSVSEAARRHGVSAFAVSKWRDRFIESGKAGLENMRPGPAGAAGTQNERRLRAEAEQLKLALAEATVQLRIWRKGAEYVEQVPSRTSTP